MKVGIFGGTFDPIHIAHLHAAEVALVQAGLDQVLFIPAGVPWQKSDRTVTPAHQRLAMTGLAVEDLRGFSVDGREVRRTGPTYTVDTVESMAEHEISLIVGADAAIGIPTWHRWEEMVEEISLIVLPRPGYELTDIPDLGTTVTRLEMEELDLSSTAIRSRIRRGLPFRFLVPAPVYGYINENQLYTEGGNGDTVRSLFDEEE